jgi:TetR/AcrR family transcriptional regulator of autoinduction and epiphytic fitness
VTPSSSATAAPSNGPTTDGRLARGQRTRRNVAEALMELLRGGEPDPTAKEVAARAGVSLRLVFHHFADMDDLYHFAAGLQLRRLWSGLPRRSPGTALDRRIEQIVDHRAALFEEITPVRRALVRRVPCSPGVRDAVSAADGLLRENLKAAFAPELDSLSPGTRVEWLEAMDVISSWETWDRLRTTSDVAVGAAKRVVTRLLAAVCAAPSAVDARPPASVVVP